MVGTIISFFISKISILPKGKYKVTHKAKISPSMLEIAVFERIESDALVDPTRKMYWRILVNEASQFKMLDYFISKSQ